MATQVRLGILALALASGACATNRAGTAAPPRDGLALLGRMRAAYLGKWFKTVTFVQQTTQTRPNGTTDTSTWYEALLTPDRLRIDIGDPAKGNGVIYTADSLYVMRSDTLARKVASGNPFLPFVAGVYAQPVDTTVRQIQPYRFDLSKMYLGTWEGRTAYVVGTQSAVDTTSPQFWIDKERLVVVRMLAPLNPADPADLVDIHLENYVAVSGGWLAVRVEILHGGQVIQKEEYSQWRGNVDLPRDFFVAEQWKAVPHWFKGR